MNKIFYINAALYWLISILGPFLNLAYGDKVLTMQVIALLLLFIFKDTDLRRSVVVLVVSHFLFTYITNVIIGPVYPSYFVIESMLFFGLAVWVSFRPEISTSKTINRDNVLLAFYKGKKGSLIMNFFELFGLPVKSMCIIAGDKCLRLHSNKDNFVISDGGKALISSKDYIVIDTGKLITKNIVTNMSKFDKIPARTSGILQLRCRCIEAVHELLGEIGSEWRPSGIIDYIPSIYFRRCINIR